MNQIHLLDPKRQTVRHHRKHIFCYRVKLAELSLVAFSGVILRFRRSNYSLAEIVFSSGCYTCISLPHFLLKANWNHNNRSVRAIDIHQQWLNCMSCSVNYSNI